MKPKFARLTRFGFHAIRDRLKEFPASSRSDEFAMWMLDCDFMPTQQTASVRWLMMETPATCKIFRVDNAGDMIELRPEEETGK